MPIEFSDKLVTGIEEIDEQHKVLIDIYNELEAAFKAGKAHRQMSEILARLFQYTKVHFADEEGLLEATDWPGLAQHQREHKQLVERIRSFVIRYRRSDKRISAEMLEFLNRWVSEHILECDLNYVDHVKEHGGRLKPAEPVEN